MGLFQKKPQTGSSAPLYTLGLQKTILIVGLGNIGKEYDLTRHNVGFLCVDSIAASLDLPGWITKKDLYCMINIGTVGDKRIIAMKPTTMMNLSGQAVQAVIHFYRVTNNNVIVLHDEMDIPFGQIRSRIGGGSAGHNGVKSLIQHIGEDFGRIRIGIGSPDKQDSADYVLSKFSKTEQGQLKDLSNEATSLVTETIYGEGLKAETRAFIS